MAKPNPELREKTRSRIIDAFWDLYEDLPLSQIKVRAVSDKAGVNRSTFYQYFDSLPNLLESAEQRLLDEIGSYLEEVTGDLDEPEIIERATDMYERFGGKLSALMGPEGDPAFVQRYKEVVKPLIIEDLGVDAADPASDLAAECVFGAMTATVFRWYTTGKLISSERLARMLRKVAIQSEDAC